MVDIEQTSEEMIEGAVEQGPRRHKILSAQEQAVYFNHRQRRRGVSDRPSAAMHQHAHFAIGLSPLLATSFPNRDRPITFWTCVRTTGASATGLVFELGDVTTAVALWLGGTTVTLRAGDVGDDAAIATFNAGGAIPSGLRLDFQAAINPGTGDVRLWVQGGLLASATAVNGAFPVGWAASSDGAFAAAAVGALPADVTETGAPTNFAVVDKLRISYSLPRRQGGFV